MEFNIVASFASDLGASGRDFAKLFLFGEPSVLLRVLEVEPEIAKLYVYSDANVISFERLQQLSRGQLFTAALEVYPDTTIDDVTRYANHILHKVYKLCAPDGVDIYLRSLKRFSADLQIELSRYH